MMNFIYSPIVKMLAAMSCIIALLLGAHFVAEHFREQGRVEVQGKFDRYVALKDAQEQKAVVDLLQKNDQLRISYEAKSREVANVFQQKIKLQDGVYQRDVAAMRAAGGLRLPGTSNVASASYAEGAAGNYDSSSTRLPESIENGLFSLAKDADTVAIQLSACQEWIRDSGLYP